MKKLTVLSLGAGVQSTCVALMAAKGEVTPMPDYAIFADTGWEPKRVYTHLEWLKEELPFEVHVATNKGRNLRDDVVKSIAGGRFSGMPLFTESPKGGGMLRRQCTLEYKITPIIQTIRKLAGLKKGERAKGKVHVEQWIGISLDEVTRMKESHIKWIDNRWPLVEMQMKRGDCLRWLKKNGYPEPTKSACIGCPYHHNSWWRDIKKNHPDEWEDAVELDELIRRGVRGTKEKCYLHSSMTPLRDVDLSNDVDRGQLTFLDECDGVCML
tara:strand:- start:1007 stop:1813 length:807 start_codon:yes stop_codon:yes gene_type:complete